MYHKKLQHLEIEDLELRIDSMYSLDELTNADLEVYVLDGDMA